MSLTFTKMHGLGNDFIVIDAIARPFSLDADQITQLADRHFGIGFDQLLVVEAPASTDMDFSYRIFNADGGEVEQCGNGARCFARYVHEKGLTDKREIRVGTLSGVIVLHITDNGRVRVDMGRPQLAPEQIPFKAEQQASSYELEVAGQLVTISAVSMGNPHAVQQVVDISTAPVATQGPLIEHHERFPQRVNAGYMQVIDRQSIHLRVWERGAGETLACGTGACAAVVAGIIQGLLDDTVTVNLAGGTLQIEWAGDDAPVMMTGPAAFVFEGTLEQT
jgi:diaminopimelate epimerase